MSESYPSKLYYSISEVSRITEVKAHVLRYWETEFPTLRPKKARTGSRRYRKQDITEIEAIKKLLYEEGFKIAGARKIRKEARKAVSAPALEVKAPDQIDLFGTMDQSHQIGFMKTEMKELLAMIRELKVEAPAKEPAEKLKEMGAEG
jgi:DNA-binding transcriptional MerR regulator